MERNRHLQRGEKKNGDPAPKIRRRGEEVISYWRIAALLSAILFPGELLDRKKRIKKDRWVIC